MMHIWEVLRDIWHYVYTLPIYKNTILRLEHDWWARHPLGLLLLALFVMSWALIIIFIVVVDICWLGKGGTWWSEISGLKHLPEPSRKYILGFQFNLLFLRWPYIVGAPQLTFSCKNGEALNPAERRWGRSTGHLVEDLECRFTILMSFNDLRWVHRPHQQ